MSNLFPEDFVWGCATASYQVEGAVNEDGRGPSIWDTFSHTPGRVAQDHNGDVACDQYHRYKEDVQLLKWLGVKAYRFSIAWSRVFPQGYGRVNDKGLDYYDRLVDELLANGIEPWATLYHWDLPQALEDQFGGWQSRETARHFGDYAGTVADRLSDRVRHFFTINEFDCFTDSGYDTGIFAPGKKLPPRQRNQVRFHGILGHGLALQSLRARARRPIQVGLAENPAVCVPAIETDEHIAAARKAMRLENPYFLTAVLEGAYPETWLSSEGANAPEFTAEDMKLIGAPLDFVGINVYTPRFVRSADNAQGYAVIPKPTSYPRMDAAWICVGPQILYWTPRFLKEVWDQNAVYISENGCACQDRLTVDKEVLDIDRIFYLRAHFGQAQRATAEGWPLKGYFLWSLLDNFEWASGYTQRFGIVYTNYQTLERIPKLSAHYYREVVSRNAVV